MSELGRAMVPCVAATTHFHPRNDAPHQRRPKRKPRIVARLKIRKRIDRDAPLRLAPPQIAPQRLAPFCSPASQLLWQGPTSRARASSATAPRLPDADRPLHATLTARQETPQCCLRANKNSRPLQRLTFRGSIPHPDAIAGFATTVASGHATLATKQDATLYSGRISTGWIAPACGWRTYSITSSASASKPRAS